MRVRARRLSCAKRMRQGNGIKYKINKSEHIIYSPAKCHHIPVELVVLYMICLLQHFCCCVEFLINVILLLFLKILIKRSKLLHILLWWWKGFRLKMCLSNFSKMLICRKISVKCWQCQQKIGRKRKFPPSATCEKFIVILRKWKIYSKSNLNFLYKFQPLLNLLSHYNESK